MRVQFHSAAQCLDPPGAKGVGLTGRTCAGPHVVRVRSVATLQAGILRDAFDCLRVCADRAQGAWYASIHVFVGTKCTGLAATVGVAKEASIAQALVNGFARFEGVRIVGAIQTAVPRDCRK